MTKNSLSQQRAAVNKKKLLQIKPVVSEPFCCGHRKAELLNEQTRKRAAALAKLTAEDRMVLGLSEDA